MDSSTPLRQGEFRRVPGNRFRNIADDTPGVSDLLLGNSKVIAVAPQPVVFLDDERGGAYLSYLGQHKLKAGALVGGAADDGIFVLFDNLQTVAVGVVFGRVALLFDGCVRLCVGRKAV